MDSLNKLSVLQKVCANHVITIDKIFLTRNIFYITKLTKDTIKGCAHLLGSLILLSFI